MEGFLIQRNATGILFLFQDIFVLFNLKNTFVATNLSDESNAAL